MVERVRRLTREHESQTLLEWLNGLVDHDVGSCDQTTVRRVDSLTSLANGSGWANVHGSASCETELGERTVASVNVPIDENAGDGLKRQEGDGRMVKHLTRCHAILADNAVKNPHNNTKQHRPKLWRKAAFE